MSTASASICAPALARENGDYSQRQRVFRRDPAGSGAGAGQADRRAVGCRRRRLSARQFPAGLGGVERAVSRHGAPLLEGRQAGWSPSSPRASPGSSDIFGYRGRRPWASVNFITAHDGFTLQDLVSYDEKHNEANGEDNRDGHDANFSWNCGVEGPTEDPAIVDAARPAEAQLPGHAAVVARRADAARRRRAGAQPGGQQQRLLPGQRDLLARLAATSGPRTRRCAASCDSSSICAGGTACSRGRAFFAARRSRRPG